jgi:hypothetical protein
MLVLFNEDRNRHGLIGRTGWSSDGDVLPVSGFEDIALRRYVAISPTEGVPAYYFVVCLKGRLT